MSYVPVFLFILVVFGLQVKSSTMNKLNVNKGLGGVAEETLTAIKVVSSFGQEEKEFAKFEEWSNKAHIIGKKAQRALAVMVGMMKASIFLFYGFAFFIGSILIQNGTINTRTGKVYSGGDVLSVIIALITGFMTLIAAIPSMQAVQAARVVGGIIFHVIDRVPRVRDKEKSKDMIDLKNEIKFNTVTFKYPTAPKEFKNILEDASFEIKAGATTAIVGPSGSGKSTIVQLIERFYDPIKGSIYFDETALTDIRLEDLRESIGYV